MFNTPTRMYDKDLSISAFIHRRNVIPYVRNTSSYIKIRQVDFFVNRQLKFILVRWAEFKKLF